MAVETIAAVTPILGAPDYREWLQLLNLATEDDKSTKFAEILPYLNEYAEGGIFARYCEQYAWVRTLIDPQANFSEILSRFRQHGNAATIIVIDFIKHYVALIITVDWQANMRGFVEQYHRGEESTGDWMREVRKGFEQALRNLNRKPLWRVLQSRLSQLSLELGCPTSSDDPLECIYIIRRHVNSIVLPASGINSGHQTGSRAQATRRGDMYKIVLICPLVVEQTAALEMLDEIHDALPRGPNDQNVYTLGSVAGHNVVVAGLPQTGNSSAATVVAEARSTFRNMRFALLVGIGGGVPTKTDSGFIRLGHVVVSKPTGIHSGVVQYDHGKAIAGTFERTGLLAPPPNLLLSAADALAIRQARSREDPIWENFGRIDTIIRGLRRYAYPGLDNDQLYQPDYIHRDSNLSCAQSGCDTSKLVQRSVDPDFDSNPYVVVHRGTIASGEQVIRDGMLRDQLAQQYNVLCFEMEAAGVITDMPCLVIRGISDYCDTHKNDLWQGFAAAAAASYARELIFHLPREATE